MILRLRSGQVYTHVLNKGGKGGGRADMAQAGGTEPAKLPQALAEVKSWIEEKL